MKKHNKYKIYTIGLLCLLGSITSCKNDFLGPDFSLVSNDVSSVYSTAQNAQGGLATCYDRVKVLSGLQMRTGGVRSGSSALAAYTDEATNAFTTTSSWSVTNGALSPNFNPDEVYATMYDGVRRCNVFLENIDMVKDDIDKKIPIWKAEARFLRALYHFELIKRYGGVIIMDKSVPTSAALADDLSSLGKARNTMAECVAFITKECSEVAAILPAKHTTPDYGRATKGAALALKAKTLLYFASPLHNPTKDLARWKSAADACKEFLAIETAAGYALHGNYRTLFTTQSAINNEVIFFVYENVGSNYDLYERQPSATGGYGGTNPTAQFIDRYEMKSGLPISNPKSGYDPQNPMLNRDPRLGLTVVAPNETWFGTPLQTWQDGYDSRTAKALKPNDGSWTGFLTKKFVDESRGSNRNFPLIRLADVYLMYAEALNEAEGPKPDVYTYVNKVRARTGIAMPALPAGISQDSMRVRIRNERAVELAFEDQRYFDARRWKTAEKEFAGPMWGFRVIKDANNKLTYSRYIFQNRKFASHWNLYPIQQFEIDRGKGLLQQNPGW